MGFSITSFTIDKELEDFLIKEKLLKLVRIRSAQNDFFKNGSLMGGYHYAQLTGMFDWESTFEGHEFWKEVHNKFNKRRKRK